MSSDDWFPFTPTDANKPNPVTTELILVLDLLLSVVVLLLEFCIAFIGLADGFFLPAGPIGLLIFFNVGD